MGEKYTWEDFERLREEMLTTRGFSSDEPILIERQRRIDYFVEYPEKLMEYGVFHEKGYDRETVIGILKGEITSTISF